MKHLIEIIEKEPRISHSVIAENTDNKNKSIQDRILKNLSDFEEFGILVIQEIESKNSVGAINKQKIYLLNEAQATLLMTYLRNNEVVRNFKKALVKEFFLLREDNNSKIKSLTGRIGGLTSTNNMYKNKIELLENQLKDQKLLPAGKTLDEKVDDLIKQTDEELKRDPVHKYDFFQNRANYFIGYIKALKGSGTDQEKYMLNHMDECSKKCKESREAKSQAEWKMNRLKDTIDEYVQISNKMLKYRHED